MKKIIYFLGILFLLFSCAKADGSLVLNESVDMGDCTDFVDEDVVGLVEALDDGISVENHEWLKVQAIANDNFLFTQHSLYTSCMSPKAKFEVTGREILLKESESGYPCETVCPRYISTKVHVDTVDYGTYTFKRKFSAKYIFEIELNAKTDTVILYK